MLTAIFLSALTLAAAHAAAGASASSPTSKPAWQTTESGQLIVRPFKTAPYPHASRENGFKAFPRDRHYTDSSVGIFIPTGFLAGDTVDFVVHFHGHKNNVSNVFEQYKLAKQLVDAHVNAILIVPQGPKDAGDSGGGKLELDPGGFERLVNEVLDFLAAEGKIKSKKVGRIAISAHSGGYKVTAAILHHGGLAPNITHVFLLDASYGSLEWFRDWIAADPKHAFVSLFTEHLADENKLLMDMLTQAKVSFSIPGESSLESGGSLKDREPLFIATQVEHDEVPVRYFGVLLKTSSLAKPASAD
jgi:hypothetical protein